MSNPKPIPIKVIHHEDGQAKSSKSGGTASPDSPLPLDRLRIGIAGIEETIKTLDFQVQDLKFTIKEIDDASKKDVKVE